MFNRKSVVIILSLVSLVFSVESKAQFMAGMSGGVQGGFAGNWGTGMYGGMQSCPYQLSAGDGASSEKDAIIEIQGLIQKDQTELQNKKRQLTQLQRKISSAERDISEVLREDVWGFVSKHIQEPYSCNSYEALCSDSDRQSKADGVTSENCQIKITDKDLPGGAQSFAQVCNSTKSGRVDAKKVCGTTAFRDPDTKKASAMKCSSALEDYQKSYAETQKLQAEVEKLEARLQRNKEGLQNAKQNYQDAIRQAQRERLEGGCVECMMQGSGYSYQKSEPDWSSVIANVGVGLLGTYMGYQTNKMVAQYNSNLGWPTQAVPAWGYGLPFIAAGIYGALGGGVGSGAFGCGSGMYGAGFPNGATGMMGPWGNGGLYGSTGMCIQSAGCPFGNAFGYPQNMMGGSLGGGMYLPGMSPFGMNGMGNMGINPYGMMNPYGNMGMNPYAMGGFGVNPYGMNGMMNPYGNMGMNGMMNPYAGLGVGMGMNPYGMGMVNPYAMGSMGMNPYGMGNGMYNPYGMGNIGMGNGMYNPYGMGNMGMGNGMYDMQYQQQMMQLQMQYQQQMMQQQQRMQENAMARQRVVSGLQQEMYSLMTRIQQVQMGYDVGNYGSSYGGNYYGGGSIGGYIGGGFNGGYNGGYYGNGYNRGPGTPVNGGSYYPSTSYPGNGPNMPTGPTR